MDVEIPRDLLELFRAARYDPTAGRGFELFAGGFTWQDENWRAIVHACFDPDRKVHARRIMVQRAIVAYRASLTLGTLRSGFEPFWQALLAAAPDWPGFRPERCSPDLRAALQDELTYDDPESWSDAPPP